MYDVKFPYLRLTQPVLALFTLTENNNTNTRLP